MSLHGLSHGARLSWKLWCWWNASSSRQLGFTAIRICLVPLTKKMQELGKQLSAEGDWCSSTICCYVCLLLAGSVLIKSIPHLLLSQAIWWDRQWSSVQVPESSSDNSETCPYAECLPWGGCLTCHSICIKTLGGKYSSSSSSRYSASGG